jgi:hypothetical protein
MHVTLTLAKDGAAERLDLTLTEWGARVTGYTRGPGHAPAETRVYLEEAALFDALAGGYEITGMYRDEEAPEFGASGAGKLPGRARLARSFGKASAITRIDVIDVIDVIDGHAGPRYELLPAKGKKVVLDPGRMESPKDEDGCGC